MLPDVFRRGQLPSIFDDFGSNSWSLNTLWDNFRTDFDRAFGDTKYYNEDNNLVYEIEVPGFNKDNLSVEISNGVLTVHGEREGCCGQTKIHKRMAVAESEEVEAEIADGILTITLIQQVPEVETKKIEIK